MWLHEWGVIAIGSMFITEEPSWAVPAGVFSQQSNLNICSGEEKADGGPQGRIN